MKARPFITLFFWTGAISMLVMSMHFFQNYITGIIRNKSVATELWYHIALRVHIGFGMIALFTAPTQFAKKLRLKYSLLHKRLGYIYVVSVVTSSLSGLVVAPFAMGGLVAVFGFSTLGILWFVFTFFGIKSAIKSKMRLHEQWMIRSFALTFSSVTLRLILLIPLLIPKVDFITTYKTASWLCWIINLIIAEWIISRLKTSNAK